MRLFLHLPLPLVASALVGAASLFAVPAAHAQTVVYNNDFSANANGFNNTARSFTPTGNNPFLGEFSNSGPITLSLTGLAPHTSTTLMFDFYAIRSLDGNATFGGGAGDSFITSVTQSGGGTTTLLSTNFANFPGNTQGFGGPNGSGGYIQTGSFAPQTGALSVNTLGYFFNGNPQDAVYRFSFTFADTSPNLVFTFNDGLNEGVGNESYGLDNVRVTTNAVPNAAAPEPATLALLTPGMAAGLMMVRRRRQQAKS